jgi:calcium-translocating P-type ATPase
MKDEKEEELISTDSDAHGTQYIGSVSGNLQSAMANAYPFTISPQELTNIVNKYKERDENMQDINYFKQKGGIDFLLESVMTDKNKGISSTVGREEYYGSNKIFRKPPPSFWDFVIEALSDKMIIILIFCSIFEIGISLYYIFGEEQTDNIDWIDGTSIIIAVLVVVSVGSITNYKKEMKFQDLNNIQQGTTKYNVVRNGIPQLIISDDILVGDLIKINYGEILPADMLLVEGNGIKIDESALTGESNAVKKNSYEKCLDELETGERNPSSMILLSGTNVIEGTGKCIAIAIGEHSQKGIIRGTIDNASEDNKTPLEHKLNTIADLIGYFGLGSAVVTLIALLIQMIVRYSIGSEEFEVSSFIKNLITIIILCVSIIVVAIPEGLPLAVTLSLSFSIKKLMDNNNLVRKMHACETMGGANIICTDKTGTLTMNVMLVRRFITSSEKIDINPTTDLENLGLIKKETKGDFKKKKREDHTNIIQNEEYWDTLYTAIALNVDSTIFKLDEPDENNDMEICETKNKTDKGFIEFLYQFKSPVSVKKDEFLTNKDFYKISPFDSKKKRMTTYIKSDKFPTGYRLFTKGGAENAMVFCNRYLNKET